ncbi:MAG: GDP-L-fucose synthase family protein [Opitutales bacterium]
MDKDAKIYVAGHRGMVGSAVVRALRARNYTNVITRTRKELDLMNQAEVRAFYRAERPDAAVIAAARVGGIHANAAYPADFMMENLAIAQNAVDGAYSAGVGRLLFLGSTCIYPKHAEQPMQESCLLTGPLEPTNEAYALAKIAGLKLCQFYRRQHGVCYHSAMPTNLYGPGDNYHPENSHVLPALIRRFHEAKENGDPEVVVWGTGKPRREFLHADDAAAALVHLLELESPPDWVNLGCGADISIGELAALVQKTVGYEGELKFDTSKPDGTPRKLCDVSRILETGWQPRIPIEAGIAKAYRSFLEEKAEGRLRE